jgi:hypothetical protein
MKNQKIIISLVIFCLASGIYANSLKKLNSINCARILAQRNIVETVYGVKIRFLEEVTNISEGNFLGTTETKTGKRAIKGIEFIEKYDPVNDIAQVTAILKLKKISDIIDTDKFHLDKYPNKSIKRTAFASSTPKMVKKLAALRAAEIEAYKNLYKRIGGFTLESQSKVENFILKSDSVKASVIGALMGTEFVGFSWEGKGDDAIAVVKLRLNLQELADMLGEKIINYEGKFVEATGRAAQDNKPAKPASNCRNKTAAPQIIEGEIEIMP